MFSSLIKTGIGHSGMDLSAVLLEVTSIAATLLQLYIAEVPFYCRKFSPLGIFARAIFHLTFRNVARFSTYFV